MRSFTHENMRAGWRDRGMFPYERPWDIPGPPAPDIDSYANYDEAYDTSYMPPPPMPPYYAEPPPAYPGYPPPDLDYGPPPSDEDEGPPPDEGDEGDGGGAPPEAYGPPSPVYGPPAPGYGPAMGPEGPGPGGLGPDDEGDEGDDASLHVTAGIGPGGAHVHATGGGGIGDFLSSAAHVAAQYLSGKGKSDSAGTPDSTIVDDTGSTDSNGQSQTQTSPEDGQDAGASSDDASRDTSSDDAEGDGMSAQGEFGLEEGPLFADTGELLGRSYEGEMDLPIAEGVDLATAMFGRDPTFGWTADVEDLDWGGAMIDPYGTWPGSPAPNMPRFAGEADNPDLMTLLTGGEVGSEMYPETHRVATIKL
jgi:hypothetical protein